MSEKKYPGFQPAKKNNLLFWQKKKKDGLTQNNPAPPPPPENQMVRPLTLRICFKNFKCTLSISGDAWKPHTSELKLRMGKTNNNK